MSKNQWKSLTFSLVAAIASLVLLINLSLSPQKAMAQITSVNQIIDVRSDFPAYPALKFLVEKYGINVTYMPGGNLFYGQREIKRGDIVNWINQLLDRFNELSTALINDPDLPAETDIANLKTRVKSLQAKVRLIQQPQPK